MAWTFTSYRDAQFDFEGQQYTMRAGETFSTDDACRMKAFIGAWRGTTEAGVANEAPNAIEDLNDACPASDGPDAGPSVPATNTNPAQGASDTPAPQGDENAQTLNAPQPDTQSTVQSSPRETATDDGRPLSQQYLDRQNPMPDYEVSDQLQSQGVTPAGMDKAMESVVHNDAPDGQPHPNFSRDDRDLQNTVVDPVITFTGSFTVTSLDVEIASIGFPLRLIRMYRSGTPSFGPWGYNWDHNYNAYIRELTDGSIAVWTGHFSEDVFKPSATGYEPPLGVFRRLEHLAPPADPSTGYLLTEPGGMQLLFTRPTGWPRPDRIPLTQIQDRHGNAHTLAYDAEGRLQQVSDSAGRFIAFAYGDCGLLESVSDHSGRTWRYWHDDDVEHLVAVTTPATSDHPDGTTCRYEYDRDQTHPALIHNLTRLIDGEDVLVVENVYGNDPRSEDWGRVVYQNYGGYEATFETVQLQYVPRDASMVNVPAVQVSVVDPGILRVYTFNYRGDLLDERLRLGLDGTFRLCARTYAYDEQGNVAEQYEPDGHGYVYRYDAANPDPTARGNLLQVTEVPEPTHPMVPRDVFRATYEAKYQLPQVVIDAGGAQTEYLYDYQTAGTGTGCLVEIRHPSTTQPDGSTLAATERLHYNSQGQLVRHEEAGGVHEFEYLTTSQVTGYLGRRTTTAGGATVTESYRYDPVGNLLARIDGLGNVTSYAVNATSQVEVVTPPDGSRWEYHWDGAGHLAYALEPRGAYDDPVLAGNPIRNEFAFDARGQLIAERYAVNTVAPRSTAYRRSAEGQPVEVTDAIGRVWSRRFDERGLTLEETLTDANGVVAYRRQYQYSRSGRLVSANLDGGPRLLLEYDGFGQLARLTAPDGSTVSYAREIRGLVAQVEVNDSPTSGGTLLARRRYEYNERAGVRRQVDVVFDTAAGPHVDIETRYWTDERVRPSIIAEPGGLERRRAYGPNSVLLEESDSLGNVVSWHLDAAGRTADIEIREAASTGGVSVGVWTREYDSRGRVTGEADPLGNRNTYSHDARGLLTDALNPVGTALKLAYDAQGAVVRSELAGQSILQTRDAAGRVRSIQDPSGTALEVEHDAQDRVTRITRADGRFQTFAYDPTGAIADFTDFDGTGIAYSNNEVGLPQSIRATPAAGVQPTADLTLTWDGMRRLVGASTPGAARSLRYDSLGRLTADEGAESIHLRYDPPGRTRWLQYPDGRQDRHEFDPLGRLERVVQDTAGSLPLAAQGFSPGTALVEVAWAGANRLESIRAGGLSTVLDYDRAFRLASSTQSDGGGAVLRSELNVRDGLGFRRAVGRRAPGESDSSYRYDSTSRLEVSHDGLPGATVPPPGGLDQPAQDAVAAAAASAPYGQETSIAYSAGDMPRAVVERDASGTVVSSHAFTTNALQQYTDVDGVAALYDSAGNLRKLGTREYDFDAFRRLVRVRDGLSVIAQLAYDPLGRLSSRVEGTSATSFTYLGHEVVQETRSAAVAQFVPSPHLDQPAIKSTSAATELLAYGSIGSLALVCDANGTVLERYRYGAFGAPEILDPTGTVRPASAIGMNPRFMGREYMDSCGLYDFRDRYMDPNLLCFLQPDPFMLADGWSPYAFVGFNPLNFADPYGRWLHILLGAVVGAAIGGVSAALSGGDLGDILAGVGAGAVGGAVTAATGNIALGAAAAGGLMGMWTGGRIGYRSGGVGGAVLGGAVGTVAGAGLGYAGGAIASRVGNAVATSTAGLINRALVQRGVASGTSWVAARYLGMVGGGYAGGATAGVFTNTTSTLLVDAATGRPVTGGQLWDATVHGIAVDGPLNAVGAVGERYIMISNLPGRQSNVFGAEGELLVGRDLGVAPARGSETITGTTSGRTRRPDFPTARTLADYNAVVEAKNKAYVFDERGGQLTDFADFAAGNGAELWVYTRPGADIASSVLGLPNARFMPIPQQPMVVTVPVPEFDRRLPSK